MIEQSALVLLTVEGFIARYYEVLPEWGNNVSAYNAVERQYEWYFGKRKYSDYESFRITLSRFITKKNTNVKKET